MIFDDLCLKIYFWPFLSYLANLKGLCRFYHPGHSTTTLPVISSSLIPTFQPTPPTTLEPCPAEPLVCLPSGERPIPYCPCIDPRLQNGQTAIPDFATEIISPVDNLRNSQLNLPTIFPPATLANEVMIFSHLDTSNKRRKREKRQSL